MSGPALMKRNKKKILLFPPHTKEVNRASIGDKSAIFFPFFFIRNRSIVGSQVFRMETGGSIYPGEIYKRTAREREREREGERFMAEGSDRLWKEEENGGGLFSSVSDFSLSTSS